MRASSDNSIAGLPVAPVLPEVLVVPDVLANRQADLPPVELDGQVLGRRPEVTVFVDTS